jgi:hypothetical protein
MGRIGITYRDVAKAASGLVEEHKTPTVDAIRQCLGTGSKSTILPYLRRWKVEHETGGSPLNTLAPEELLNGVKNLYEQLQYKADHKIQENLTLEREKQHLESEHSALSRQLSKLQKENQLLHNQLIDIKCALKKWSSLLL